MARQLQRNGVNADWLHEGCLSHPIFVDVESSIQDFMVEALARWTAFVDHVRSSGQVMVIEACFFNNLIESLLAHNVAGPEIIQYYHELEKVVEPLNPALIYLTPNDVHQALENNFCNRGPGFTDFVIELATGTPYAKQRGLQGYAGMVTFWQGFVALTDRL